MPKTTRLCDLEGCGRKHVAKGMCSYHYRKANPPAKNKPVTCPQCGEVTMRRDARRAEAKVASGFCSLICRDVWRLESGHNPAPPSRKTKRVSRLPADHPVRVLIRNQGIAAGQEKARQRRRSTLLDAIETSDWPMVIQCIEERSVLVGGCWLWTQGRGYGRIRLRNGKNILAHRLAMSAALGGIVPSYMPVHHTCAEGLCCNPQHLQVVTPAENTAEMMERHYYQRRIAELEAALHIADPRHPLLMSLISPAA